MSNKGIPPHELKNEIDLLAQYPQLNVPQVSRRALLAMGSLMALNLTACGSSDDTGAGNSSSGSGGSYVSGAVVTTLAGSGSPGTANGTGAAASFFSPQGVAVDSSGNIYVADGGDNMIRQITSGGVVTTFAGSTAPGTTDGTGTAARFFSPQGVAVDSSGNVYVADTNSNTIRQITSAGVVTTLAGQGPNNYGSTNGTGTAASFYHPTGVAVDSNGNVYVADRSNNLIRKITSAGVVTTLAGGGVGSGGTGPATNGTGTAASFYHPFGVAVDSSGNVYVADSSNNMIRQITSAGVVTTLAGSGTPTYADGTGTAASFNSPNGVAVNSSGNVYVADSSNNMIRQITSAGVVTTVAGSTLQGTANGTGAAASFLYPNSVAVDSSGNAYVADLGNKMIRKIS